MGRSTTTAAICFPPQEQVGTYGDRPRTAARNKSSSASSTNPSAVEPTRRRAFRRRPARKRRPRRVADFVLLVVHLGLIEAVLLVGVAVVVPLVVGVEVADQAVGGAGTEEGVDQGVDA